MFSRSFKSRFENRIGFEAPKIKAVNNLLTIGISYTEKDIENIDDGTLNHFATIANNLYAASILNPNNWAMIAGLQIDLHHYASIIDKLSINFLLTQENFEFIMNHEELDTLAHIIRVLFYEKILNSKNFERLKQQDNLDELFISIQNLVRLGSLTQANFEMITTKTHSNFITLAFYDLKLRGLLSPQNILFVINHHCVRNLATAIHELFVAKILNQYTLDIIIPQNSPQTMAANLQSIHFCGLLTPENVEILNRHPQLGLLTQILDYLYDKGLLNQTTFDAISSQPKLDTVYQTIQYYTFCNKSIQENLYIILANPRQAHRDLKREEASTQQASKLKLPFFPEVKSKEFTSSQEPYFKFFSRAEHLSAHRFTSAKDQKAYDQAFGLTIYSPKS